MRKSLKLKASVFIIAWMTFFAHSVMPHNHIDEASESFRHLVHNSVTCTDSNENASKINQEKENEEACHFTNFLFHSLNPELILTCTFRNSGFIPDFQVSGICINNFKYLSSTQSEGSTLLRAPPLS